MDNNSSSNQHDHQQQEGGGEGGGRGRKLGSTTSQPRRRPLRSISSAIINSSNNNNKNSGTMTTQNLETRLFRAAARSTYPDIDLRLFRELSAEATILSGLEKEILRYDEMEIPKFYKFGVLSVRDGQTTEEEWFANSSLSESLERFLNIIGRPIELEGYKGYTAGLDTKCKFLFLLLLLLLLLLYIKLYRLMDNNKVLFIYSWRIWKILICNIMA